MSKDDPYLRPLWWYYHARKKWVFWVSTDPEFYTLSALLTELYVPMIAKSASRKYWLITFRPTKIRVFRTEAEARAAAELLV